MTLDDLTASVPVGWRYHVGHTPHWYMSDAIPKYLRKRPFEAYVTNDHPIGSRRHVFESADGATAVDALASALRAAVANDAAKASLNER
jgi:hypothetical protein